MKSLQEYFEHYSSAHRHPANRACHRVGIPLIVISIFLLIFSPWKKAAWALFAVGWAFQFIGHAVEKSWPEFFSDPLYLLIGPLYFLYGIFNRRR